MRCPGARYARRTAATPAARTVLAVTALASGCGGCAVARLEDHL
ncbi:hypothetical protein [Streptomyces sp. NPDC047079]